MTDIINTDTNIRLIAYSSVGMNRKRVNKGVFDKEYTSVSTFIAKIANLIAE